MRALNHWGMALAGDFMNKFGRKIQLESNVDIFFFYLKLEREIKFTRKGRGIFSRRLMILLKIIC